MKRFSLLTAIMMGLLLFTHCGKSNELVFIHFNDTHSQILPFESDGIQVGGIARRIALVKEYEEQYKNVIVIDAGGAMTGSAYCSYYEGEMDIELMNRMGVDMMTVGYHEFDHGYNQLLNLREMADFPFLSANIYSLKSGNRAFTATISTNIAGIDLAFVGLSSSDWSIIDQKMKEHISIQDEEETLRSLFADTDIDDNNDLLILVNHVGYNQDLNLAKEFPAVDIIFSGNGDFLSVYPEEAGGALVLQAGDRGEYVGVLIYDHKNGELQDYSYELLRVTDEFEAGEEDLAYIAEKTEELEQWMETIVCESHIELANEDIRKYSTPEGNFIADIYRDVSEADFAIINAGSIRAGIPTGEISLGGIYEIVPYDNMLMKVTVSGSVVSNVLLKGIKQRYEGAFLQVSSELRVEKGNDSGIKVLVDFEPIDLDQEYTVAISDFMYLGGDGYDDFTNNTDVVNTGYLMRDALIYRLENMAKIYRENISFDERIIFEDEL